MSQKSDLTSAGEALCDVILETSNTFFRIREVGNRFGAAVPWGGGTLGLLQTLRMQGPHTVPEIARTRPVARQHIQKLANDLAAQGLIEFVDNPERQRSKLLRLTRKGEELFDQVYSRLLSFAEEAAKDLDATALRATADGLKKVRERLERI